MSFSRILRALAIVSCVAGLCPAETIPSVLPGTERLQLSGTWREEQRQQLLRYLDRAIEASAGARDREWKPALISPEAFLRVVDQQRSRLAAITGFELHSAAQVSRKLLGETAAARVEDLELTAADRFISIALLITPPDAKPGSILIAIPSDNAAPGDFAAKDPVVSGALRQRERVAVLVTVPRDTDHPLCKQLHGSDRRHILHRLAFNVGRTLPGLEAAQAAMLREYLTRDPGTHASLYGEGQGGMTALLAAALDPKFSSAKIAGYFSSAETAVQAQPADRAIYGLLPHFGNAELAALVAPRTLELVAVSPNAHPEFVRAQRYFAAAGDAAALRAVPASAAPAAQIPSIDDLALVNRNFEQLHTYERALIDKSESERYAYWGLLKPGDPAAKSERIRRELGSWMGVPRETAAPMHPRTRLLLITDKFAAYDVILGVLDGVEVYGHLLIPRGVSAPMPAVICQHGLDGQPKDISGVGPDPANAYHQFGRRLAERGYVVFAPYLTVPTPVEEKINPLVRRAVALGMMRTALEVRKLSRVVDFLQTLPSVDRDRIGYYGLSYGGYSTLWMGPLEPRFKTIVISGHFNDWRAKVSNEELATSYMMHPDEDMFGFNALRRFTHPELIAAMLPRPVMVEFADHDSTTTPEWHQRAWRQAEEIAAALQASNKLSRDAFQGIHEIGGMRTFDWLDRWLRPGEPSDRNYTYLLWPANRDLPGLADNAEDTLPYESVALGGEPGVPLLRAGFQTGNASHFAGLAFRLSIVGNPPPLVVKYGSTEGGADLGTTAIPAGEVRPLYDLWYRAKIKPVGVTPAKPYFVELSLGGSCPPGSSYVVYGRKPLGGHSFPSSFYFAFRPETRVFTPGQEPAFEFVRNYLDEPGDPVFQRQRSARAGDVTLDSTWRVEASAPDEVVSTSIASLRRFLKTCCGVVESSAARHRILLEIRPVVPGIQTAEGFRLDARPETITISATTSRGVMRGVYALEDMLRQHQAPIVTAGVITRNPRFARRITTSILPGGERYTETSKPMIYTDRLLERISRDGFNAVWIWFNTEQGATGSKIFPELDDPHALERFARMEDLSRRARRFGIDVYVYLATGYDHFIPDWFWKKYPELKGQGFGPPMCTSDNRTLAYQAEIVRNLFTHAPDLKGMVVIYDHEGFYYCGNTDRSRTRCPRCSKSTCEALSTQVLRNLDTALHVAAGPDKEFIAWSYGLENWVENIIPMLPKDVKIQVDFSKGGEVIRDGIHHQTGDYNLTLIGPPDFFERRNRMSAQLGLDFITKTEHAVSQEFIFAPYIPAMEQWLRRIEMIRQYPAAGWFGNWDHYGYLASVPAQLFNQMSFDPPPADPLRTLAEVNYGSAAADSVLAAWNHFSDGIRQFPYSDAVSRLPGPLQKGPSNPLFLDPKVPEFGRWRAWQNDLKWTAPWGPQVAHKYLGKVRDEFHAGNLLLDKAADSAPEAVHRDAIRAEWRIARTIEASLDSVLNLIEWIEARDRFWSTQDPAERAKIAQSLREIALREQKNAKTILPVLDSDSRLGYASEGGGVQRGGLFTPDLVRWKIGEIDDVLQRQLPGALESDNRTPSFP